MCYQFIRRLNKKIDSIALKLPRRRRTFNDFRIKQAIIPYDLFRSHRDASPCLCDIGGVSPRAMGEGIVYCEIKKIMQGRR
jgi:hypothetical protein